MKGVYSLILIPTNSLRCLVRVNNWAELESVLLSQTYSLILSYCLRNLNLVKALAEMLDKVDSQ